MWPPVEPHQTNAGAMCNETSPARAGPVYQLPSLGGPQPPGALSLVEHLPGCELDLERVALDAVVEQPPCRPRLLPRSTPSTTSTQIPCTGLSLRSPRPLIGLPDVPSLHW